MTTSIRKIRGLATHIHCKTIDLNKNSITKRRRIKGNEKKLNLACQYRPSLKRPPRSRVLKISF